MLLNISFQHRFTVFFDYACLNISRKQDKGDVNSVDVILQHRYSLIIFHYINLSLIYQEL